MRRTLLVASALLFTACSAPEAITAMHFSLGGASLSPSDVGSVEILVLGGDRATCARALQPQSPLDDPELEVLRHALFTVDGSAKRLSGIPAGQPLVFYAEAFQSPDGQRPRVGRGCTEDTLTPGSSAGISIELTADPAP